MIAVAHDVTRAIVEAERPGLEAWCSRKGWPIEVDLHSARLALRMPHPKDAPGIPELKLVADLVNYRAVPPAWRFVEPDGGEVTPRAFPRPGPSSIFHSKLVICAPWNRLAYASEGGPHGNWSGTGNWLNVSGHTRATTLADMLAAIHVHLQASPGRMA